MKHIALFLIGLFACVSSSFAAGFSVSGGTYFQASKNDIKGIEELYAFNGLSGVQLIYTSGDPAITFKKYTSNGVMQTIPSSDISITSFGGETVYTISNLQDSYGYFAEKESKAAWIIDYSIHAVTLNSVRVITPQGTENQADIIERCGEGDDRGTLSLDIERNENAIRYYTPVTNEPHELGRKYNIEWNDQKFNDKTMSFVDEAQKIENITLGNPTSLENKAPLIDTEFTVLGDHIARALGITRQAKSETYKAVNVEVYIERKIITDGIEDGSEGDESNSGDDTSTDENSAPLEVHFYAYANKPTAYYYEWYVYKDDPDRINYILKRQDETDFIYTFTQAGTYEVVLYVSSNDENFCAKEKSLKFDISESSLEIPNFFSPGTSIGINDEFKVKYKSIIKFKATIFNRWGNKIYEWNDPELGWDGKYKGKYVSPGVYFYVIEATGAEGKKYKKGGDINIVRGK